MKIGVNATSAKMGGAATYLESVLPELARQIGPDARSEITVWGSASPPEDERIKIRPHAGASRGGFRRMYFDQVALPSLLKRGGHDVLYSSANIGPFRTPCRHVVLVRNPVFFSKTYISRMTSRRVKLRLKLERHLTLRSIGSADHVLFPTQAMMEMVTTYTGGPGQNWSVAPYGARHETFHPSRDERASSPDEPLKLLHVSHYCDQKDMATLFSAVRRVEEAKPSAFHLTTTAGLESMDPASNPHCPTIVADQAVAHEMTIGGVLTDLGTTPYDQLPGLYRQSDIFVFPSYTESFGHPLVEAMASGLPVVAADTAVNREMCGEAAIYFTPFAPAKLAQAILAVADDTDLRARLVVKGLQRAKRFTWEAHVAQLLSALEGVAPAARRAA